MCCGTANITGPAKVDGTVSSSAWKCPGGAPGRKVLMSGLAAGIDVGIIRFTLNQWNQWFKLLGALALLVSLALPMARGCTPVRYEDATGKPVSPDATRALPPDV